MTDKPMTQAEYNAKVQAIQAALPEDVTRVSPQYHKGELYRALFQVHCDGWWWSLGIQENPMQPNTKYYWDDGLEIKVCAKAADALVRS
jgi:hypothetical protein